MLIDAHQHFWKIGRGDYGWLTPEAGAIYRDFAPADLKPLLRRHGIAATILVQAAPSLAETRFLLRLAAHSEWVAGVAGWADFDSEDAPEMIDRLQENPLLVGLRPMVQDIADENWLLRSEIVPAIEAMIRHRLVFDALVLPRHLAPLCTLIERHPGLRVVLDHAGKPRIRERQLDPWRADVAAIAARPGVCCKLSGLVTEADADWKVDDLRPYFSHLLEVFGPGRLIWGSDWPVVLLAGGYDAWRAATLDLLAPLAEVERAAILGANATRVYLGGRGRAALKALPAPKDDREFGAKRGRMDRLGRP